MTVTSAMLDEGMEIAHFNAVRVLQPGSTFFDDAYSDALLGLVKASKKLGEQDPIVWPKMANAYCRWNVINGIASRIAKDGKKGQYVYFTTAVDDDDFTQPQDLRADHDFDAVEAQIDLRLIVRSNSTAPRGTRLTSKELEAIDHYLANPDLEVREDENNYRCRQRAVRKLRVTSGC